MVTKIMHAGEMLGLILAGNFREEGIHFFTPKSFSQQLGYMNRPAGYTIPPHVHNPVTREVHHTHEVLFVKSGRVRVDFYDENQVYLESRIIASGDVLLLARGGHGFEMLEPSELIEVKQGPYAGEEDKTRFSPVTPERIQIETNAT
jgi:mannose-6-phosphate isomerase-like protein (cupin superfamily)